MMPASALRPPRLGPPSPSRRAERLLDELEEVFLAEGFHHLSIAALATRLRASRRTFYELAPSRDELVLVVLDRIFQRMGREAHDRIAAVKDPLDRIEVFLSTAFPELRRMSVRFSEDLERQPSADRLYAAHVRYGTALVGDMVQDAIDAGRARDFDPYFVAEALNAMVTRLNEPDYRHASRLSFEESVREMLRFFRAALEVPPRPRKARNADVVRSPSRAGEAGRGRVGASA